MNLVTLTTTIVIAMAVIELLLHGMSRMKKNLFQIAIIIAFVGFTSKYYYGPDITTYVPIYEGTENIIEFCKGNFFHSYERGYVFFCSLCQTFGLSFWGMTAVVSALFFLALYLTLKRLEDKRVLAMALIIAMVPDLIYAQFRQCLAVSFFVFALLKAEDWKEHGFMHKRDAFSAIVLGLISMTMHKSAIFIVGLTFLYYLVQPCRMHNRSTWSVLLLMLLILAIVPTQSLLMGFVESLDDSKPVTYSIKLHLSFAKLRQSNLLVYGAALLVLMNYARERERRMSMVAAVAMGMIITVAFYQYYYMLNRLKSYFVILVVYYIFREMHRAGIERMPFVAITRQVCEILLLLFVSYKVYAFDQNSLKEGNLLQASTVFELADNKPEELKKRQMAKAAKYWETQFLKTEFENKNINTSPTE